MSTRFLRRPWGSLVTVLAFLLGAQTTSAAAPAERTEPSLREVFAGDFLIGAAVNPRQYAEQVPAQVNLVTHHFNTITPENRLKPSQVQPEEGKFVWEGADAFVAFGEAHHMFLIGHTLVWHNQTAEWMFQGEDGGLPTREVAIERLRNHIQTVVGRYRGRIKGWDVLNEAIGDDGKLRPTPWLESIGEDYIEMVFRFAHEADPEAQLYYNDYSMADPAKRAGVIQLLRGLLDRGVPVHGVGLQQHIHMDWPSVAELEEMFEDFRTLGLPLMVTELDVNVLPLAFDHMGADITLNAELRDELNPYPDGLPEEVSLALAQRYSDVFRVYLRHRDALQRVTFWGINDANSWLNNWPVVGRTNYPFLFDRAGEPKAAFQAVVDLARE